MIKGTGRLDELTRLGEEAGQIIRSVAEERGSIVVVNHFDADGISAVVGHLLTSGLLRPYRKRLSKKSKASNQTS